VRLAVCPKCGNPSEGGLCPDCELQSFRFLSCPEALDITICSVCGSQLRKKKWQAADRSLEESIWQEIRDAVSWREDLGDACLEIKVIPRGATRFLAMVRLSGAFRDRSICERGEIPVKVNLVACETCSRKAGKYFEATVQVRGSNSRTMTADEMERCQALAESMAEAGLEGGERLSFIQEMKETKGGLDIVLGSAQLGRQLAKAIFQCLGGKQEETSKLVGRRDGRDIYRITLLVRLPRLTKGDIVLLRGNLFCVEGFSGRRTLVDPLTGVGRRRSWSEKEAEEAEVLGNRSEAQKAVVVAVDSNVLEIIDPESYKTAFASRPAGIDAQPGEEVEVIKTARGFIVLG
jgi:nonsense-mediated mRNA decay protein 3